MNSINIILLIILFSIINLNYGKILTPFNTEKSRVKDIDSSYNYDSKIKSKYSPYIFERLDQHTNVQDIISEILSNEEKHNSTTFLDETDCIVIEIGQDLVEAQRYGDLINFIEINFIYPNFITRYNEMPFISYLLRDALEMNNEIVNPDHPRNCNMIKDWIKARVKYPSKKELYFSYIQRILKSRGNIINLNARDKCGWTAIMYACMLEDPDFVLLLYNHGSSINIVGYDYNSPMSIALIRDDNLMIHALKSVVGNSY